MLLLILIYFLNLAIISKPRVITCLGYKTVYIYPDWDGSAGDPCRITHSAEPGLCALITKCPPVASKAHRQRHTVCGFRGLEPIVCCPLAVDIPALPYIPDMPPVEIHNDDLFPHTDHSTQRRAQRTSSTSNSFYCRAHEFACICKHAVCFSSATCVCE